MLRVTVLFAIATLLANTYAASANLFHHGSDELFELRPDRSTSDNYHLCLHLNSDAAPDAIRECMRMQRANHHTAKSLLASFRSLIGGTDQYVLLDVVRGCEFRNSIGGLGISWTGVNACLHDAFNCRAKTSEHVICKALDRALD